MIQQQQQQTSQWVLTPVQFNLVDNSNQAASSENNSAQLVDSSEKKTAGSPVKVCISYSCVTFVQKLFH